MLGTPLFEVFVAFLREGIGATPLNRRIEGSLSCLAWPARCKMVATRVIHLVACMLPRLCTGRPTSLITGIVELSLQCVQNGNIHHLSLVNY